MNIRFRKTTPSKKNKKRVVVDLKHFLTSEERTNIKVHLKTAVERAKKIGGRKHFRKYSTKHEIVFITREGLKDSIINLIKVLNNETNKI